MTDIETRINEVTYELLRYCGPIFVAPSLSSYPEDMIGNGTFGLVDTGQKRLLITCSHVWDEYQKQHDSNSETILAVTLGEGDSNIAFKHPEGHLLGINRDLDLAVFEFEPEGIGVRHNKSWFKISEWPIPKVEKGECIVTLGFPEVWRKAAGTECKFGCVAIPLVIGDTSDRTMMAVFSDAENQQVLHDMKDSFSGFSGGPAYRLADDGKLRLVGFAKLGPSRSDARDGEPDCATESPLLGVFFTHASFLQRDGTLG